ncbi:AbrB/MazE/SpoVT family DNA-binding domain-containing protein [Aurantimonas sp. C2-6-R+9]|nr:MULTISPECIES: AbrB/MazE/SpoVT family DNA-binding domain-containing protein [unclassified Aurantimonas]MEC5289249.1 AbrB/MazE/SpoVT family DNA-binding domain-containing protein [Aurantimonas sp. C2-3-R2]MEC5323031.1 AbrB/MazE/SpoVT family DNA-binding domain-containing protein [Aurantimonas sp. A3-2-R12]MEC5380115.1 AbrB/MazE/SpoVT family DNA-binding domain-containing protein [Aurantimonas sp. C2-6-R+9]MEC5410301.1 AbrB/MazE/SpoVT family DNA-binding domain-containing protein [Aurantimonas sp. 
MEGERQVRVTEKGQVTIPKAIRDKLGIVPGSEVDFVDTGDAVRLVRTCADDDPVVWNRAFDRHVAEMRGTIDTDGMDGKFYVDWLRGPREDLDVD